MIVTSTPKAINVADKQNTRNPLTPTPSKATVNLKALHAPIADKDYNLVDFILDETKAVLGTSAVLVGKLFFDKASAEQ